MPSICVIFGCPGRSRGDVDVTAIYFNKKGPAMRRALLAPRGAKGLIAESNKSLTETEEQFHCRICSFAWWAWKEEKPGSGDQAFDMESSMTAVRYYSYRQCDWQNPLRSSVGNASSNSSESGFGFGQMQRAATDAVAS
jgi:hypothetical protein